MSQTTKILRFDVPILCIVLMMLFLAVFNIFEFGDDSLTFFVTVILFVAFLAMFTLVSYVVFLFIYCFFRDRNRIELDFTDDYIEIPVTGFFKKRRLDRAEISETILSLDKVVFVTTSKEEILVSVESQFYFQRDKFLSLVKNA